MTPASQSSGGDPLLTALGPNWALVDPAMTSGTLVG